MPSVIPMTPTVGSATGTVAYIREPTTVSMTPVISAAPLNRDEPCVYDSWQNPRVYYRDAEAWRMYDNDMCAYHALREREGRAARNDDLGIDDDFALQSWQRVPPRPPRRELGDSVPQSSTPAVPLPPDENASLTQPDFAQAVMDGTLPEASRLDGDQSYLPEEFRGPPRPVQDLDDEATDVSEGGTMH